MTAEKYDPGSLVERLDAFFAANETGKSAYVLIGNEEVEQAVPQLSIMAFASEKGIDTFDVAILTRNGWASEQFRKVTELKDVSFTDERNDPSPFRDETQAFWYSRKRNIPFAILLAGHAYESEETPVVILNILRSVDPKIIFNRFQEVCREQLRVSK